MPLTPATNVENNEIESQKTMCRRADVINFGRGGGELEVRDTEVLLNYVRQPSKHDLLVVFCKLPGTLDEC